MNDERPSSPILFSTVTYTKFIVQKRFRDDTYWVWCSEHFNPNSLNRYHPDFKTGPTSNPAEIYRTLHLAVEKGDRHCNKIKQQKTTLKQLAADWYSNDEISKAQAEEIVEMTRLTDFKNWRPLVFVVPTAAVIDRVRLVPYPERSAEGREWIIEDLQRKEFRIMEFVQ